MNKVGELGTAGHVLLVEDEASISAALALLLDMENYLVTEAADGRLGLAALEQNVPDLIITDYMMPYMNGAEMIRRIRAEPRYDRVPIILMSAVSPRDAGVEEMIDAFLLKPPSLERLFDLVERAVAKGREGVRTSDDS